MGQLRTQNGGLRRSTGTTNCPPSIAHRSRRLTPCQRRHRASNSAYQARSVPRLCHSFSGVPLVPLPATLHARHTVGLADALTCADLDAARRPAQRADAGSRAETLHSP